MGEESFEIEVNNEKTPFEEKVMNDFYLSFKFSQQNARDLHERLMAYTAREYSVDEIKQILENNTRFKELAEQLTLPSQHGKVLNPDPAKVNIREGIKREFLDKWMMQCDIFTAALDERTAEIAPRYSYHSVTGPEKNLISSIAYEMLKKDIQYVQTGRPNRPDDKKYESFLRTYSVEGQPTGSDIYDELFDKLKIVLQNPPTEFVYDIGEKVSILSKEWEAKHPDKIFLLHSSKN